MKMNEREERGRGAGADEKKAPSSKLEVRSGVRAGRTWRSGNKVWSDDWLAPV
jgi:hemolysin-activating ACP:hemolysin acyltransferase